MTTRDQSEFRRAVTRLSIQFTALIVAILALMGGLLYSIVTTAASESDNRKMAAATLIDSPRDAPLDVFVAIFNNGQLAVSRNMPAGLPDTSAISRVLASHRSETGTSQVGGRSYAVLTAFHDGRVAQAALDRHESQEEADRLVLAMSTTGAAAAVLAALVSVWMAGRALRPLAESLALQRRFVADASHELRTPLTLLSTRAQMLRRKLTRPGAGPAPEEVADGVEGIVEDAKLLTGILDDLLISADPRAAADYEPVNLGSIGANATALAEAEAQKRSILLESKFPSVPVTVRGSEVSLGRVFTALISNSLDHARSAVTIQVSAQGREAVIRVADDGPGFPPDFDTRAFERFASSRADAGKEGVSRHYGLGLALVAEIATLHKGTVGIDSGPTGGAAVVVTLPLA
ncbi:HAMP domain-containing histidine kinase [Arthrobacter sp. 24S4-2]|nr:HAMP domain-containing histidine kinase [Arthrobacter sp. 24S4-2]